MNPDPQFEQHRGQEQTSHIRTQHSYKLRGNGALWLQQQFEELVFSNTKTLQTEPGLLQVLVLTVLFRGRELEAIMHKGKECQPVL